MASETSVFRGGASMLCARGRSSIYLGVTCIYKYIHVCTYICMYIYEQLGFGGGARHVPRESSTCRAAER